MADTAPKSPQQKRKERAAERAKESASQAGQAFPKPDEAPPIPELPDTNYTATERKLIESLAGTYQTIGMVVIGTAKDTETQAAGIHIIEGAESVAQSWVDLGRKNAKVRQALHKFTEGGAFAGVVTAHIFLLLPLASAKGVLPAQFANAVNLNPNAAAAAAANGNGVG